jgi:hypothetical protein
MPSGAAAQHGDKRADAAAVGAGGSAESADMS